MLNRKVMMYLIVDTLDDTEGKLVKEFDNINDLNDFIQDAEAFDGNNVSAMKIVSGIVLEERVRELDA